MSKIKIPNPFADWSEEDFVRPLTDDVVEKEGVHHHESVLSFLKENHGVEGYSYDELSDNHVISFEFYEGEPLDGDLFFYPDVFTAYVGAK